MAATSIPNATSTLVLAAKASTASVPGVRPDGKAVWFQNFDTTYPVYLNVGTSATTEFLLPPATDSTHPSTLIIQASGGDTTLVNAAWYAYHAKGSTMTDFTCGRW